MMEHEIFNEPGHDGLSQAELMADIKSRCAKRAGYLRWCAIMWLVVAALLAAMGHRVHWDNWKDWINLFLPFASMLLCLFYVLWYEKMSKCNNANRLLNMFGKGSKWANVIVAFPSVSLGYYAGMLIDGHLIDRYGVAVDVTFIISLLLATATIIYSCSAIKSLKKDYIEDLREIQDSESR